MQGPVVIVIKFYAQERRIASVGNRLGLIDEYDLYQTSRGQPRLAYAPDLLERQIGHIDIERRTRPHGSDQLD